MYVQKVWQKVCWRRCDMGKVVVIYYHEVVEKGQGYSYQKIEKDKFEAQMRYLYEQGYKSILFSDLDKALPEKSIIVSFDDGFRTVYEKAAPIMKKYGIHGNIYLPTKYIGTDSHFMTWEMVKELSEDKFFEMQAHTHTHIDIRRLNEQSVKEQINESDKMFQKHLERFPQAFCMPFGTYDKKSIKLLKKESRYNYLLGSYYGRIKSKNISGRVLPRIGISNNDSLELFADKLNGKYDWKGPLQRLRLMWKNVKKERITEYEY
ncbi:polysaccharide deacetylase family protein [Dorea formicigenerans]|uniref:Polysaccharide deacetylase family protein n=2 Tax=Dorea formicigenerans TaxID=39486 RepID=A0A412EZS6_9FIRM|nr:polysaccharide deacetylase family protein [Dorea formicigenerans]